MQNSTIKISLNSPIEFSYKNELVFGTELTATAPSHKNRPQIIQLKQMLLRAIMSMSDVGAKASEASVEAGGDGKDIDGKGLISLLYMSDIDLVKFFDVAKDLLTSGVLTIGEGEKFTGFLFTKLSDDDFENVVGEYIANFIVGSILK